MVQIINKTANIWEYKVGINAIIANFVCLWKCRLRTLNPEGNPGQLCSREGSFDEDVYLLHLLPTWQETIHE